LKDILPRHATELNPVYASLEPLEDPGVRAEACRLLDFLASQQIAVPRELAFLGVAIPALRAGVEAAHPSRSCIRFIVERFAQWVAKLAAAARPVFLEQFATLAPAAEDLGDAGMAQAIDAVNRDPRVMASLAAYAMTNREIVLAMAKLAGETARSGRVDLLQSLVASLPVEQMEESKDAKKLVPAIAAVPQALPVAVALTSRSPSTAYGVCRALRKLLPGHLHTAAYLEDFLLLAESIGVQCAGYCTAVLPGLYARHGVEATRQFVATAADCARRYGAFAAMALLERRTAASRELLS
jgi:hypothetical protein